MFKAVPKSVEVFGLPFFAGDVNMFTSKVEKDLESRHTHFPIVILTPNPEHIILAEEYPDFYLLLQKGTYLTPDGGGIVLASKLFHRFGQATASLTQRLTGVEIVHRFLRHFPREKILLVGGRGYEHLEKATLRGEDQGIPWFELEKHQVYWLSAYADAKHPTPEEEQKIKEAFIRLRPDIVFVAFGAPLQEKWIFDHLDLLQLLKVRVAMVVGGSFDFLTAKVKRAPVLIQELGLEWLYRLIQEPWRWKRQLRLVRFGWLTLTLLLRQR